MPKLPKVFIYLLAALFLIFPPIASAGRGPVDREGFERSVYEDSQYNKPSFDDLTVNNVMNTLLTKTAGCFTQVCPEEEQQGAAIHGLSGAIAGIYANPPASGVMYAIDLINHSGLGEPAYAQGAGFTALQPILGLWKAARNFSYLLFIVIFLGIGFAIMFRVKISPQATITIQSALPKLIVGLILITFSYAIAGFIIDLTYLFFTILVYGLQAFGGITSGQATAQVQEYTSANFTQTLGFVIGRTRTAVEQFAQAGGGATAIATAILSIVAVLFPAAIIGIIPLAFSMAITVFIFLFRVFIALVRAYVVLIISIVFGPLIITLDVFRGATSPGGLGLGTWGRTLLSNILVFPAVGIVIFIANAIINAVEVAASAGIQFWSAPYLGGSADMVQAAVGFGAVLILPEIPGTLQQLFAQRVPGLGAEFGAVPRQVAEDINRRVTAAIQAARQPQVVAPPGVPPPAGGP